MTQKIWVLYRNDRPLLLAWDKLHLVPYLSHIEHSRIEEEPLSKVLEGMHD
jgi:hypothetical protein